jgi:predicted amidohydrolase
LQKLKYQFRFEFLKTKLDEIMKISVAQTRPIKGNIEANILNHRRLIDLAITGKVEMIIFPELSITGYEPELAQELATTQDNSRFDIFQEISDNHHITIGIGVPTQSDLGIRISTVIFQANQPRQTYSKQHLHSSETPFFVEGNHHTFLSNNQVALAICYELSIPEHSANAFQNGSNVYIASTVNSYNGVDKDLGILQNIAKNYSMTVLMANCIGLTGEYNCAGKSSVWNNKGHLVGQMDDQHEGILIFDRETEILTEKWI